MIQELLNHLASQGGEVVQRGHILHYTQTLAERNVLLGKRKLVYQAKITVDEQAREVVVAETLVEKGFGLAPEAGWGTKVEVQRLRGKVREGSIEEHSKLLGQHYSYRFDFSAFHKELESLAQERGYRLRFVLTAP